MITPSVSPFAARSTSWLDLSLASERELEVVADGEVLPALRAVWVRRGLWHPTVLTGWCPLGRGEWAARLQSGPEDDAVWTHYKGAGLQPILPMDGLPPGELADLARRNR